MLSGVSAACVLVCGFFVLFVYSVFCFVLVFPSSNGPPRC